MTPACSAAPAPSRRPWREFPSTAPRSRMAVESSATAAPSRRRPSAGRPFDDGHVLHDHRGDFRRASRAQIDWRAVQPFGRPGLSRQVAWDSQVAEWAGPGYYGGGYGGRGGGFFSSMLGRTRRRSRGKLAL